MTTTLSDTEYNVLVVSAAFNAIQSAKRALPMILQIIASNRPSDEALWEIYAECREHFSHPGVRKFYYELSGIFGNEHRVVAEEELDG